MREPDFGVLCPKAGRGNLIGHAGTGYVGIVLEEVWIKSGDLWGGIHE